MEYFLAILQSFKVVPSLHVHTLYLIQLQLPQPQFSPLHCLWLQLPAINSCSSASSHEILWNINRIGFWSATMICNTLAVSVPADGLAPLGARPSAGTLMTNFGSCTCIWLALKGLTPGIGISTSSLSDYPDQMQGVSQGENFKLDLFYMLWSDHFCPKDLKRSKLDLFHVYRVITFVQQDSIKLDVFYMM